ncbi:ubiquitin carboxyl-terminal hydrolase CYLD-like isoform X2 [Ptychodera flava]|uniref:ubiquitin carboxyl-terminal hydrolase CYLD-like isoform X2 n=1 Tax=Ptychodera flava TaxID=63121 RepID=UPI00396A75FC
MSRRLSPYFILLKDQIVPRQGKTALVNRPEAKDRQVLGGTLLELVEVRARDAGRPHTSVITGPGGEKLKFRSLDHDNIRLECSHNEVARISTEEKDLLLALVTLRERYDLYVDRKKLDWGLSIKIDSRVLVEIPTLVHKAPGKVRYKGPLPGASGTHFGVELLHDKGQGTTNGVFRKQQFFRCEQDCGVFVSIQKLTFEGHTENVHKPRDDRSRTGKNHGDTEMHIGMRVVIFCAAEDGKERQEYGTVRYIGTPKKLKGEKYVGIELDNPAGKGSGKYEGEQLFQARKDHATLVPIDAVLPACHLEDTNAAKPDSATATSSNLSDVLNEASKELGMSKGDLLKEQEELFREYEKKKEQESRVPATKLVGRHLSDGMHRAIPEEPSKRIPGVAYPSDGARNSVFYTDGDNAEDAPQKTNSTFYVQTPDRGRDSDYEYMAPQPNPTYENISRSPTYKNPTKPNHGNLRVSIEDSSKPTNPGARTGKRGLSRDYSDDSPDPPAYLLRSPSPKLLTPHYFSKGLSHELRSNTAPDRSSDHRLQRSYSDSYSPTARAMDSPPVFPSAKDQSADQDAVFTDQAEKKDERNRVSLHRTMSIGSMVEIMGDPPKYGVIKWMGILPDTEKDAVGVELEEEITGCTDGTFKGIRLFDCPPRRGIFVLSKNVRPDSRFATNHSARHRTLSEAFGQYDSPMVEEYIAPPDELTPELIGFGKGIQGHHNSCYLDTTLYSMFAFSLAFDELILRDMGGSDLQQFEEVQNILKSGIVNPLRKHGFVRADRVLKFRELLDKFGSVSGLTTEEKDPEEFLNTVHQIFKSEPYVKVRDSRGEEHSFFFYQMFMERDESKSLPTVQQLFEQSFLVSDIKLVEVPGCLLVQMPRYGKNYKMYDRVIPSLTLDITDVLDGFPRQCTICQGLAEHECRDCNTAKSFNDQITAYCSECAKRTHSHQKRKNHKYTELSLPEDVKTFYRENPGEIERQCMELFAVVCIETSHYVAFVKSGSGEDKQWCFFDSMADRKGEEDGHNIPAVTHLPDFVTWLQDDKIKKTEIKDMPEHLRRLVCDAYLLFYQSPDTLMYGTSSKPH